MNALGTSPQRKPKAVKVLVADDSYLFRIFMRYVLEAQSDLDVVAEASDADEALQLTRKLQPDVVLMSVHLPRWGGLEATRRIKAENFQIHVLVMSEIGGAEYQEASANAGADGFLVKDAEIFQIISAIRRASDIEMRGGR